MGSRAGAVIKLTSLPLKSSKLGTKSRWFLTLGNMNITNVEYTVRELMKVNIKLIILSL